MVAATNQLVRAMPGLQSRPHWESCFCLSRRSAIVKAHCWIGSVDKLRRGCTELWRVNTDRIRAGAGNPGAGRGDEFATPGRVPYSY